MNFDVHRHARHVRDGDDGLPLADGGAFADGILISVVVFPRAAIDHQPGFLGADGAFPELVVQILALAGLHFVLALGGLQLGPGLRQFGDGHAPGLVQFAHGLGVIREGFFGGF